MSKSIDDRYIELRQKMKEYDQLISTSELPDGVFMHQVTDRIHIRLIDQFRQAWMELADNEAIVRKIGKASK